MFLNFSDYLGPPDEYSARIDVEVDSPESANVLKSIPLSARSGTPRIYAPKGLQVYPEKRVFLSYDLFLYYFCIVLLMVICNLCFQSLLMLARIGLSTRQQLPLKNAGNIKVDLKIMVGDLFLFHEIILKLLST